MLILLSKDPDYLCICYILKMTVNSKLYFLLQKLNWPMAFYLSLVHLLAFTGLLNYLIYCKLETLVWFAMLMFWTKVGITGGCHRLWAHRSYQAHWTIRLFYMLLTSIANQGSIYHWVRDHRTHHKYSETDSDPHNVSNGQAYYRCFKTWKHIT